jgi:hypothetical protein
LGLPGEVAGGPYSEVCKHEAAGEPILDTTGSLTITGRDDAPTELGVGAYEDGTGGLNVVACVPSAVYGDPRPPRAHDDPDAV